MHETWSISSARCLKARRSAKSRNEEKDDVSWVAANDDERDSIDFRSIFPSSLNDAAKVKSQSGIDPPYLPRSAVATHTYLLFTFHLHAG